jgi:hypothetical protein
MVGMVNVFTVIYMFWWGISAHFPITGKAYLGTILTEKHFNKIEKFYFWVFEQKKLLA